MAPPAIIPVIDASQPSARGELKLTDAFQHLIDQDTAVPALEIPCGWHDVGDPQSVLCTNRFILQTEDQAAHGLRVEASGRIEASRLIAPVSIGGGALVVDSVVGPNVSLGVARGRLISDDHLPAPSATRKRRTKRGSVG